MPNRAYYDKHSPDCLECHPSCPCNTCKHDNYSSGDSDSDCCFQLKHNCYMDGTADPCKYYEPEEDEHERI